MLNAPARARWRTRISYICKSSVEPTHESIHLACRKWGAGMPRTRWKSHGNTPVSYGGLRGGRERDERIQHRDEGGREGTGFSGTRWWAEYWSVGWASGMVSSSPPPQATYSPYLSSLSHQSTRLVTEAEVGRTLVAWWSSPQLPAKSWWDWTLAVGVPWGKGWRMDRVAEGRLYPSRKGLPRVLYRSCSCESRELDRQLVHDPDRLLSQGTFSSVWIPDHRTRRFSTPLLCLCLALSLALITFSLSLSPSLSLSLSPFLSLFLLQSHFRLSSSPLSCPPLSLLYPPYSIHLAVAPLALSAHTPRLCPLNLFLDRCLSLPRVAHVCL